MEHAHADRHADPITTRADDHARDLVDRLMQFAQGDPYERALYDAYQELQGVLQGHPESFIQAVWLQFRRTPALQKCEPESIKAAAVTVALSGLDITQPGEVWLIPLKGKCVAWDGYLGRLRLARQSPGVIDVWFDVVRERDQYTFCGHGQRPRHSYPPGFDTPRGRIIGAYCVVEFDDGRVKALQMSHDEIKAHKTQYARAGESDAWREFNGTTENRGYQHMCAKVVINQLCHPRHLTMSREATQFIVRQEAVLHEAAPPNGHTRQPQWPTGAADRRDELSPTFGDGTTTPGEREPRPGGTVVLPPQQMRLRIATLANDYLYPGKDEELLNTAAACFGCEQWTEVAGLSASLLEAGLPQLEAFCQHLSSQGHAPQGAAGATPQGAPAHNESQDDGDHGSTEKRTDGDSGALQDESFVSLLDTLHGLVGSVITPIDKEEVRIRLKADLAALIFKQATWAAVEALPADAEVLATGIPEFESLCLRIRDNGVPQPDSGGGFQTWIRAERKRREKLVATAAGTGATGGEEKAESAVL